MRGILMRRVASLSPLQYPAACAGPGRSPGCSRGAWKGQITIKPAADSHSQLMAPRRRPQTYHQTTFIHASFLPCKLGSAPVDGGKAGGHGAPGNADCGEPERAAQPCHDHVGRHCGANQGQLVRQVCSLQAVGRLPLLRGCTAWRMLQASVQGVAPICCQPLPHLGTARSQ